MTLDAVLETKVVNEKTTRQLAEMDDFNRRPPQEKAEVLGRYLGWNTDTFTLAVGETKEMAWTRLATERANRAINLMMQYDDKRMAGMEVPIDIPLELSGRELNPFERFLVGREEFGSRMMLRYSGEDWSKTGLEPYSVGWAHAVRAKKGEKISKAWMKRP